MNYASANNSSSAAATPPADYLTALANSFDAVGFARESLQFHPDAKQQAILNCNAKRVILNCSRQWGKSTVVAAKAVHVAATNPGSLVVVVSPALRQSGEFLRKAELFLQTLGIKPKGDGINRISAQLPNGSRLVGISDAHDTNRGFSAATLLIFDEAAQISDEMYRAMRPVLATSQGAVWLLSTPYGKRGFFYDEWVSGDNWTLFSVKATDCPRIPQPFLDQERRDLGPDYFAQEYMCHFFAPMDAIFDEATVRRAVLEGPGPLFTPNSPYQLAASETNTHRILKREFFIGLDLGQRRDYSALVILESAEIASNERSPLTFAPTVTTRRTVRHIERLGLRTPYPDIVERATRIANKLAEIAPTNLIIDATGGGIPVRDMFQNPAAKWRFAPVMIGSGFRESYVDGFWRVSKMDLVGRLQLAFDFNHFTIEPTLPNTETLVEELAAMRGFERKRGRIMEAPGRKHDDIALALTLAWWGVETRLPGTLGVDKRLI